MTRRFATLASVAILGIAVSGIAFAQATRDDHNSPPGRELRANIAPNSAQPTRGVVFFTAAINSDGTIAGCFGAIPQIPKG
jgi:hypothetical protein